MANPRNIFAYTAPGADYPAYVSLNECDGRIELTVRSPKPAVEGYGSSAFGQAATIELPRELMEHLLRDLQRELAIEALKVAR